MDHYEWKVHKIQIALQLIRLFKWKGTIALLKAKYMEDRKSIYHIDM